MTSLLIESVLIFLQIAILLPGVYVGVLYLLEEDGPFNVFWRIRALSGFQSEAVRELQPDGNTEETIIQVAGDGFLSRVFSCHRCLSPYVAFLVVLFGLLVGFLPLSLSVLVVWLGLTGTTVYLFERSNP